MRVFIIRSFRYFFLELNRPLGSCLFSDCLQTLFNRARSIFTLPLGQAFSPDIVLRDYSEATLIICDFKAFFKVMSREVGLSHAWDSDWHEQVNLFIWTFNLQLGARRLFCHGLLLFFLFGYRFLSLDLFFSFSLDFRNIFCLSFDGNLFLWCRLGLDFNLDRLSLLNL
jgi:hypothetical protein